MTQRVLGPTGTRRRRWTLVAPFFVAAIAWLMLATGAQAVHDTGRFQLDGDAATGTNTTGAPAATDDWDKVCYDVGVRAVADGGDGLTPAQAAARCGIATGTTGPATSSAWTAEPDTSSSIFTGGGSKDPIDLNQWAWKDAGGLPDKDNLLHGFAARYSLPSTGANTGTCPSGTATTCEVLYFGSDRFDNSGDAQQGVWFFQSKVTLNGGKVGGGTGFTGVHTPGDVLVISDFSNGGTVSTMKIFSWNPTCTKAGQVLGNLNVCGDANLETLRTSDAANCATPGLASDAFCGLVNPSTVTMPWSYTDKSGTPGNQALNGELYEGGINLSTLGLAGECFSSVLLETRSSTSTTATLKDFVLGQLGQCQPNMTTQASTNGTVIPGSSVTDTATIQITGAATPTDPTGDVTFFLCSNATNGCPSPTGTNLGTGTLDGGAVNNDGRATATSPAVNTSASPLAPGRYCFRAEWPGDSNYTGTSHTNNDTECFSVKDTTAITTAQKWLPQDTASITTGSGAAAPTGTVVFSLYENGTCSGTAATTFTDSTAPYETDNNSYRTSSTTISWSATFTPDDANAFQGSTTTRCERSDLTINNSASNFPPGP